MDREECYAWGELFASDWDSRVSGMSARAEATGLAQEALSHTLVWRKGPDEHCRWVFIDDPSDVDSIRAVYAEEGNVESPSCFVVVKQRDPEETRGDVIFDIFRMSPQSYLWHFNRVFTRPGKETD